MGSFTDVFEVDALKAVTGQTTTILSTTALAHIYVALFTANPTDAGGGTEVTGGSYARTDSKSLWATPSAGSVATNAAVTFPTASADWGTVTGVALFDASTAGNMLAWGALSASQVVANGNVFQFTSGQLIITLD